MASTLEVHPRWVAVAVMVVLVAGCATGGTGSPAARTTAKRVPVPVAMMQPRMPAPTTETMRRPARLASFRSACRVNPDSVAWILVSGGCRKGYAQGPGRARSADGRRSYSGGFVAGYFDGEGSYDWGNGIRYTGAFVHGKKTGKGMISYPDHRRYQGQFKDDLYDGAGRYDDQDGSVYDGEFRLGRFEGRGTYTWPNGDQYVGEFRNNRMEGEGVYIRNNGERCAGRFMNNAINMGQTWRTPVPN